MSHLSTPRQLPDFSRNNWQSTIRHYVTVHPEYAGMEPWTGRETSDIVYTDDEGVLTDLLIDEGHLAREIWAGKKPKYFIEVKTTTASFDTPLYVSKAQYQRVSLLQRGGVELVEQNNLVSPLTVTPKDA
jgi:hypothetical protein